MEMESVFLRWIICSSGTVCYCFPLLICCYTIAEMHSDTEKYTVKLWWDFLFSFPDIFIVLEKKKCCHSYFHKTKKLNQGIAESQYPFLLACREWAVISLKAYIEVRQSVKTVHNEEDRSLYTLDIGEFINKWEPWFCLGENVLVHRSIKSFSCFLLSFNSFWKRRSNFNHFAVYAFIINTELTLLSRWTVIFLTISFTDFPT